MCSQNSQAPLTTVLENQQINDHTTRRAVAVAHRLPESGFDQKIMSSIPLASKLFCRETAILKFALH